MAPARVPPRQLLKNPVHFLSLGFGTGLAPKAPGTFGTLPAILLVWLFAPLDVAAYLGVVAVVTLVGIYLCGQTAKAMGEHDAPAIVWDEIAGYMIAMIAVPVSWLTLLVAFVIFRFFDILKPWPIRWLDQKVHGGLGIMLDDVLAGFFTLLLMHIALSLGWL
ncbi:phosphatidylglycerophosphatase A [Aliidiomarina halalkaliphila]|uniref:Phosphatidylglycerophosphatase A n=1 Tax=Aliidiomarina halalkaliphila TaxID=2593535 RepID=A0A552WZ53_9GAMM|nr:phosphatidylglycerophosphatase A [Aliidiomarina halalkaliphila]TRW48102.1 phosphatidylglycerophosphatase A [Aliidiomarina halalkaliphila]